MKNIQKIIAILFTSIILVACADPEAQVERPAKELYEEAIYLTKDGTIKQALKAFSEVERQHPQSKYARLALSGAAQFAYDNLRYSDAIYFAESFITYNPNAVLSPKVYYIRALSYYEQINDTGRDQGTTTKALQALTDVILTYPKSTYAINARYKLDLIRNHLAGKELNVGRFYQKKGHYQSAIGRFKRVITLYPTTSQTPEALARLVETFLALGLTDEATKTAAILGYNHRNSEWYAYAYKLLKKKS